MPNRLAAITIAERRQRQDTTPAKISAAGANKAANSGRYSVTIAATADAASPPATQRVVWRPRPAVAAMKKQAMTRNWTVSGGTGASRARSGQNSIIARRAASKARAPPHPALGQFSLFESEARKSAIATATITTIAKNWARITRSVTDTPWS